MATIWQNEVKRQQGNSSTAFNDASTIFDSSSVSFGGAANPTIWVTEAKTS